jgi:hypothetical protein
MGEGRDYRKKGNTVFYSCHKKYHAVERGFIVNTGITYLIIDFNSKSPSMRRIRVRGQFFLITVQYVLVPQQKRKVTRKKTPMMI